MHFLGLIFLFLVAFFSAFLLTDFIKGDNPPVSEKSQTDYKNLYEIEQIKRAGNTTEKSKIYSKLIERVGPVQAQELLHSSGFPFTGDTHLLNHTVGDFLYKKYGPSGIVYCKDYFSSSCYHGIIINSLGDGKLDNVKVMMDACRKRGEATFGQCVHGLGHGLLPYVGYKNVLEALSLCDQVGRNIDRFNFYLCHNGVFMENIWGVHDGRPSPLRWVDANDIHYPCDDPRIDYKYLGACWYNQHTLMENYYHGDIKKVANECYNLTDESFKKECFEGMFNVIEASTQGNVDGQFSECRKMPTDWFVRCLTTQIIVEVSHGGSDSSFEICSRIDEANKRVCYKTLIDVVTFYFQPDQRGKLCNKIPREYMDGRCGKYI